MTNLIGKKVSEENETARPVFVGQNPVLAGKFLKPEEFAEHLGISLRWIYRHIKDIPHHRVGKYLRFDLESAALRHWIDSLEQRPQQ